MPSDKLTELGIKMSKSGIKEKKLYDGQGLYLLLHPNGRLAKQSDTLQIKFSV